MVTTREKKIKFDPDPSDGEPDGELDLEQPAVPAPKRRKSNKPQFTDDDPALNPGPSSEKGKEKATSDQNQLIIRRSTKGGKLRDLMNMPVDIFTEVCSYLGPYDLRRLALTSKRLWDILMTKEARHIWKTSLASVLDLPECPTDLNEPQYVCLLYSSECYTIGCTSRGSKADWFHRVRFCSACHDVKMANHWDFTFNQSVKLGLRFSTLNAIQDYFDSHHVMRLGSNYHQRRTYSMRKNNERHFYIEALKKAGRDYEALSRAESVDYLSNLKVKREYWLETGTAMVEWKNNQLASRAEDIAAEKSARFESIKAKLLEMGWDEKDFPMSNKTFKDLLLKDQKLTPKIWQNIKPKLEPLLQSSRAERLASEKRQRRMNREVAIRRFYSQIGRDIMDLPFENCRLSSFPPKTDDIFALPSIKPLLDDDTETVEEERWIQVAPEVRLVVAKWWRDSLKQLADSVENTATASPNETNVKEESTENQEAKTAETIFAEIEVLKDKLSHATTVFFCKDTSCVRRIWWFPDFIRHSSSSHYCYNMGDLSVQLRPLEHEGRELVRRLLKDLRLDPETARSSDDVVNDQSQKTFLCTRCDERVAKYMTFSELIGHYLEAQKWFNDVTEAVRKSPDSYYPSRTVNSQLPKIVNDHDWVSRDAVLVREDDNETRDTVLQLQVAFRKASLADPLCDTKGIGGEDSQKNHWGEILRCCLLCPRSFAPFPCATTRIELHIRKKHDKEPDLEKDTTFERIYSSNPCPL
ncbi:hypothetical protein M407DRAFT_17972 [Tulasnella calospora MUT 4182]|uniref:F-box domain-containing protein n=1 Tax=Tulasnella calospora MUT 4182 TaxID=1051891 RepID=A0A0C3QUL5_9AGAM|nr:hypothetical protein M407DRAFT_17972 [Tulasnella calospora MUT 4182]